MNKKARFDVGIIGERVSAEIPEEPSKEPRDPDVVTAMDEKRKLRIKGKYNQKQKQDFISKTRGVMRNKNINEIHEMLEGKITPEDEKYYINYSLIKKMVAMNPYIQSVRHLAELCGFVNDWHLSNSALYQALVGSKSQYKPLNKKQMKKVAHALGFENWRVLIHPDVHPNAATNKEKSKAYLDEVAKIEAEFDN